MSPKVTEEYKEKKKLDILMASTKVFQRKGFEPTTMKDIKEEAGISFGALYSYFSSTSEIFEGILNLSNQDFKEQPDTLTCWERFERFITEQNQHLKEIQSSFIPVAYEYFMTAWREKDRLAFLQERYKWSIQFHLDLLKEGIENGEFQPTVAVEIIAHQIVTTLEGLNITALLIGYEQAMVSSQLDLLKDNIRKMLGA